MEPIKVLIVDDHPVIRDGLSAIFQTEPDIIVVGLAKDGQEGIDKALEFQPDVVLMDIIMPVYDGLEATAVISQKLPSAKVLIMTASERDDDLVQAFRLGARGYLLKSSDVAEVVAAVRRTANGEAVVSPELAAKLVGELNKKSEGDKQQNLSPRETEVLDLAAEGLTDSQIAAKLYISENTVRTYFSRLLEKLHARNRVQAVNYAARHKRTGR